MSEIQTVKHQGNGFLVNGSMSVPNDPANRHYQMIQEFIANGGVVDPEFTDAELLAQQKQQALIQAKAEYDTGIKQLIGDVPYTEIASWDKQEAEARAVLADANVATPFIDALRVSRGLGESRVELAGKIVANADAYALGAADLLGKYQAKLKEIEGLV